jgi:hypothetical protein
LYVSAVPLIVYVLPPTATFVGVYSVRSVLLQPEEKTGDDVLLVELGLDFAVEDVLVKLEV